mgnify:CR=1 FL=1
MILLKVQAFGHGNWQYIKPEAGVWAVENGRLLVSGWRWNRKLGRFNANCIEYSLADYETVDLEEKDLPGEG